jgi:hypothetical protein
MVTRVPDPLAARPRHLPWARAAGPGRRCWPEFAKKKPRTPSQARTVRSVARCAVGALGCCTLRDESKRHFCLFVYPIRTLEVQLSSQFFFIRNSEDS